MVGEVVGGTVGGRWRVCQTGGKVPPRALRYSFPWPLGGSLRDAPQWLYFSNECGVDRGVSR